jgi:hypothetical protein
VFHRVNFYLSTLAVAGVVQTFPKLAVTVAIQAAKRAKSMLVVDVAEATRVKDCTFRRAHYKCASAEKDVFVVIISASYPSVRKRQLP